MIEINEFLVKEASGAYGEVAHLNKTAFELNIDPANVLGAMTGGYVAKRHYDKQKEKQREHDRTMQRRQSFAQGGLQEQAEPQMRQMLQQLKIVFTPINVVYLVNGATVEIIRTNEMSPKMREAFMKKDAAFFRSLLMNKMNMEIQLVQQAMVQSMLASTGLPKQASGQQLYEAFDRRFEERGETELKDRGERLLEKMAGETIDIPVNLDGLRPFVNHEFFFDDTLKKVASLFEMEVFNASDLDGKLEVGFLPDRVTFLVDGQMIEQLPLLSMNEQGVIAFRIRDKAFFKRYYLDTARKEEAHFAGLALDKRAMDLGELSEALAKETMRLRPAKTQYRYFEDPEIHPFLYLKLFDKRYPDWREQSTEALIAQVEDDFDTAVSPIAFDKIAMIKTLSNPEHSIFMSDFTYEKMVRAFAGNHVDFAGYQGGVSLGDLIFANEVASILTGGENFVAFDDSLIEYTVNQVTDEGVRFILPTLFEDEEDAEGESYYYRLVNGTLARVWAEDEEEGFHESAVALATTILTGHAERVDPSDIEGSVAAMLENADERLVSAVAEQVGSHFEAAEQLEVRRLLYQEQRDALAQDWEVEL